MRLESTLVPTISLTARMSAVVSVRVTRITMSIEMMLAISKVGIPNPKICGRAKMSPSPTLLKSALPRKIATIVPSTIESRIARRETAPTGILLRTRTITSVMPASSRLSAGAPFAAPPSPVPTIQPAATGSRLRPIVVITVPVTTGGKNRITVANTGAISRPITEAAITDPKTAGSPPPLVTIAPMVATPANETPCTRGSWDPKNGTPTVCRIVARPPMNRHAAMSTPISPGFSPAICPMMSGGAMMPPYIVSTCWMP